jgi:hypothetical protein
VSKLTPLQLRVLAAADAGKVFVPRGLGDVAVSSWFIDRGPRHYIDARCVRALLARNLVFTDRHNDALDKVGLTAEGGQALDGYRSRQRVTSPLTRIDEARIAETPYAQRMRLATAEIYLALACSHMLDELDDTDHGEEIAARYGLTRADLKVLANRIGARLEKLAMTNGYDMAWVDLDPVLNPNAA